MFKRIIIFLILLSITCNVGAQMYIGITGDLGNQLDANPPTDFLKRPMSVSGSVFFLNREEIRNEWFLQYGVTVGVMGYSVKAKGEDTVSNSVDYPYDVFPDYTTLFVSVPIGLGKTFSINKRAVSVVVGAGFSQYYSLFPGGTTGSVSIFSDDSFKTVFEYEMSGADKKVKGFVEGSLQTKLTDRILMGIQYRYHFKPALRGTYNFYHTKEPSSGTLSLTQRAFSILFMIRIGKKGSNP